MTNVPSICSGVNSIWKKDNRKPSIRLSNVDRLQTSHTTPPPDPPTLTFTIIVPFQMIKLQPVPSIPVHQWPWISVVCYCQCRWALFLGLTCGRSSVFIITPDRDVTSNLGQVIFRPPDLSDPWESRGRVKAIMEVNFMKMIWTCAETWKSFKIWVRV